MLEKHTAETEEADSDVDNLTSLNEVLLDEREVVSEEEKYSVLEPNVYDEIAQPSESLSLEAVSNSSQTVEKGINESCKVRCVT